MTKYIVSGYIGFDNFGDEAIAKVLTDRLKESGAEKITLISSNPSKTAEVYGVESCGMFKFFLPLLKSDVLISGGGSLLQDVTSLKSLMYYLTVIYYAFILGKKVEIFAQGIGPIKSKIGRFLTYFALKFADKISVRDSKSQELLNSWGINCELVQDPVMELKLPKLNKTGTVGIQLRKFEGVNDEFLTKLAFEIQANFADKKFVLISLQDSNDLEICKKFSQILKQSGIESEIMYNLGFDEVINSISNLEYLIAMRFHANVVGIKSGVKTLAINYDPKVEKLAKEYNLPMIDLFQKNFSKAFEKLVKQ